MSREKQIEEMANDLCDENNNGVCSITNTPCDLKCLHRTTVLRLCNKGYRKASDLEEKLADVTANWQKIHDAYNTDCIEHYNKGRSEVAREIFEEIDRMCIDTFGNFNHRVFAELKKKYTEEGK